MFFFIVNQSVYSQDETLKSDKVDEVIAIDEEEDDTSNDQVMRLEEVVIKIEPVRPMIELKRREMKPKDYTFFRSFEKEVQQVPNDLLRVRFNAEENKIDNLKKILSKDRK